MVHWLFLTTRELNKKKYFLFCGYWLCMTVGYFWSDQHISYNLSEISTNFYEDIIKSVIFSELQTFLWALIIQFNVMINRDDALIFLRTHGRSLPKALVARI